MAKIILKGAAALEWKEMGEIRCPICKGELLPVRFKPTQNRFKWKCINPDCNQFDKLKTSIKIKKELEGIKNGL